MLVKIYPENPDQDLIRQVADLIRSGGVVILPTDSVYGFACDYSKPKAVERLARLKNLKPEKADFSFMFENLSMVSDFTKPLENSIFKLIKKNTPGPFTFIIESNQKIQKFSKNNKKTLGVRIPDNEIVLAIVRELGHPILTSSVIDEDDIVEYTTDPSLIAERFVNQVDVIIDGGFGKNEPTSIIDCTSGETIIVREGVLPLIY